MKNIKRKNKIKRLKLFKNDKVKFRKKSRKIITNGETPVVEEDK